MAPLCAVLECVHLHHPRRVPAGVAHSFEAVLVDRRARLVGVVKKVSGDAQKL